MVLAGLDLASKDTAPILCKAETETEIIAQAETINTITDAEANLEEKAAIKVNKQSSMKLSGTGTLNVNGKYKNGVKGGAQTDLLVEEQTLNIYAVDNGLAADNSVTVKSGKLTITSGGDGIKSSPDEDDTVSAGDILLEGGQMEIHSAADGIQGDHSVTIQEGSYQITANGGCSTALSEDTESCKGIKSDTELTIYGGRFEIDSADDALHSNQYIRVLGGSFLLKTGDDGMHADTSLIIGEEGEDSSIDISIPTCYEGLEAGTVYVNSGDISIYSSDDGINAAGGSDGSGGNGGPGDGFHPGGGMPGGPGGRTAENAVYASQGSPDYAIYIKGGNIFVKAAGDGLDSNGDIYISGGDTIVYGAAAGAQGSDNFPFDHDVSFEITGGRLFGAGSSQMEESVSYASQKYIISRNNYSQGSAVRVEDSQGEVLFSTVLEERVNYMLYSSPEMESSGTYSFKTGNAAEKTELGNCRVSLTQDVYLYDGTAKEPGVTVSYAGNLLTQEEDYTVSYQGNVNVGTAKVIITGKGKYFGTVIKEFTIQEPNQEPGTGDGQETEKEPGTGDGQETEKEPETGNGQETEKEPGTGDGQETEKEPGTGQTPQVSQVKGVSAVPVNTSKIKVSWKKVQGADGYEIYRYNTSKKSWQRIKTNTKETACSYMDQGKKSGVVYKYRVRAYVIRDARKYCGGFSKTVTAAAKPAKGSIKKAAAKKNAIVLKWKKTACSGYEICYSEKKDFAGGGKTIKVKYSSKTARTINGLKSKKIYYVKVRSYVKAGGRICYGAYSTVKKVKTKE